MTDVDARRAGPDESYDAFLCAAADYRNGLALWRLVEDLDRGE